MSTRFVKICGITEIADAMAAVDFGADAVGFNFYPRSPRYIEPARARTIVQTIAGKVLCVGVFVDAARAEIEEIASAVGLSGLQFHGQETPEDCDGWKQTTIKALRLKAPPTARECHGYRVDFILADAYVEGQFGGTGKRLEVEYLQGFDRTRLIVAGGLTAENVADVVRVVDPFGVDVASGIETAPGMKDREQMRRFIENARAA